MSTVSFTIHEALTADPTLDAHLLKQCVKINILRLLLRRLLALLRLLGGGLFLHNLNDLDLLDDRFGGLQISEIALAPQYRARNQSPPSGYRTKPFRGGSECDE